MASYEVVKGCKKYTIQRVINPITYWVTEYESGEREKNNSGCLLPSDVERLKKGVQVGDVIAVLVRGGFQRGLVTDIYSRNFVKKYCILLIDNGNGETAESDEGNLYLIKNKKLQENGNLNSFEVTIPGIQPAAVEIKYHQHFLSEVFQRKCCDSWLPTAFQFVQGLIKNIQYVFLKPVHCDKGKVLGEIFIVRKADGGIVSLSEQLCERGFALPQTLSSELLIKKSDVSIEDKIPHSALESKKQICAAPEPESTAKKKGKSSNLSVLEVSTPSSKSLSEVGGAERKLSNFSNGNSGSLSPTAVQNSEMVSYSPSWILKKLQSINSSSSSCGNSVKGDHKSGEGEQKRFFKVVQKNLELFNKIKQSKE